MRREHIRGCSSKKSAVPLVSTHTYVGRIILSVGPFDQLHRHRDFIFGLGINPVLLSVKRCGSIPPITVKPTVRLDMPEIVNSLYAVFQ